MKELNVPRYGILQAKRQWKVVDSRMVGIALFFLFRASITVHYLARVIRVRVVNSLCCLPLMYTLYNPYTHTHTSKQEQ